MAKLNRTWLEEVMAQRGITYYALQKEFSFHRDTILGWENGKVARPHSVRKLAAILGVAVPTLVRNLRIEVMVSKAQPPKN